ncbi:MAG: UbiA family prenyltransferase, partial [Aestuariivirgaceae bacterium]
IGGAAGAFPPVVGWAAVTGNVDLVSMSLFLIIFMWTPPHFWALALFRSNDYQRAGVPMMPVVAGPDETRWQILLYALAMVPVTLLPFFLGFAGWFYAVTGLALSLAFAWYAWRVYLDRNGDVAERSARRLFGFSIVFLFAVFAALLVEHIAWRMPALTTGWGG